MTPGERKRHAARYELNIYVTGSSQSRTALSNLRRLCDDYLPGQCRIRVIDLLKNPKAARDEQIVAVPTVIRKTPPFPGKGHRRYVG